MLLHFLVPTGALRYAEALELGTAALDHRGSAAVPAHSCINAPYSTMCHTQCADSGLLVLCSVRITVLLLFDAQLIREHGGGFRPEQPSNSL